MKMRKFGKLFRKAALTAAICLGLSQSVWAMPSGGTVTAGSVTVNGGAFVDPASGATIATNGRSIINWNSFGIANGESLTFNTANGALLNRVTGANLSEIYGTLTQTGGNPMFLVNPNGILVGKGAVIDANQIVLSTLAMSDATFMNDTLNDKCVLTTPTGRTTPAALQFKDGAKVSINSFLKAFGGTVEVADGVTFSAANNADINLIAANTVNGRISQKSVQGMSGTADKNTVTISNSAVKSNGQVYLQGGNFNISGSDIRGKEFYLRSAENFVMGSSQNSENTTVTIKDSIIHAKKDTDGVDENIGNSFIVGGNVSISDSNVHGIEHVRAFEGWDYDTNTYATYTASPSNVVTVTGSKLDSARRVRVQGGRVSVSKESALDAPQIQLWAENKYINDGNIITHNKSYTSDNTATITNSKLNAISEISVLGKSTVTQSNLTSDGEVYFLGGGFDVNGSDVTASEVYFRSAENYIPGEKQESNNTVVTVKDSIITSTKDDNGVKEEIGNSFIVGGNVSISDSELHGIENVRAFEGWTQTTDADTSVKSTAYTTNPSNVVSITGSKLDSARRVRLQAGKVSVSEETEVAAPRIHLWAEHKYTTMDNGSDLEHNAVESGNEVSLSNSAFNADERINVLGWKAGITESKMNAPYITLTTFTKRSDDGNVRKYTLSPTDNTLSISGSQLTGTELVSLLGGTAEVSDSALKGGRMSVRAAKEATTVRANENISNYSYQKNDNAPVTITNSEISATMGGPNIMGGTVFVKGSTINNIPRITAVKEWRTQSNPDTPYNVYTADSTNTVEIAGSKIRISNGNVSIVGGKAMIRERSEITAPKYVEVIATQNQSISNNTGATHNVYSADGTNTVEIAGSKLASSSDKVTIIGGKATISEGSEIDAARFAQVWIGKQLDLSNDGSTSRDGISYSVKKVEATTENEAMISTSKIKSGAGTRTNILGGKIGVTDSALDAEEIRIHAIESRILDGPETKGNSSVAIRGSELTANGDIRVSGGMITMEDSTLSGGDRVRLTASSSSEPFGETTIHTMNTDNTITANNLTVTGAKTAYILGGKVELNKSNIHANNTETKDDVRIVAAPGLTTGYNGVAFENGVQPLFSASTTPSSDYTVTLKKTNVTLDASGDNASSLNIFGGKVTLDRSNVTLTGGNDNSISMYALSGLERDADVVSMATTGTENAITITNGSKIASNGERLELGAGKIAITDESEVGTTGAAFIVASDEIGFEEQTGISTDVPVAKGTKGEIAVSTDSKILQDGVDVTDKFATSRPEPNPTPVPTPDIGKDETETVANAAETMNEVLGKAKTPEAQKSATRQLVENINQEATDDRTKAAQITGVMLAILKDDSLSDTDKITLQVEVVNSFAPTQRAKTKADNTVSNATQTTSNVAMNQPAAADAMAPGAVGEESPVRMSE